MLLFILPISDCHLRIAQYICVSLKQDHTVGRRIISSLYLLDLIEAEFYVEHFDDGVIDAFLD